MKPSNTPPPRPLALEPLEDDDTPRPESRSQTPDKPRSGNPRSAKRKTAGGRFREFNAFIDFTAGTLERSELLVWLTLFRDCRDGITRTGQADLARRTRIGERTVRHAIGKLAQRGLLEIVRRGGISAGPSTYRLRPLEPAQIDPGAPAK